MLRRAGAGLAMVAALTMALTGCGDKKKATAPKVKPAEALAAAVTKTSGVSLKMTTDAVENGGALIAATYDAAQKVASLTEKGSGGADITVIVTGDALFVSNPDGKWMRMRVAKMQTKGLDEGSALLGPLMLLRGAAKVTEAGKGSFNGTVDLAKTQPVTVLEKRVVDLATKAAGAKANAIPFTVSVDANNYITRATLTLPAIADGQDGRMDVKYSDFGTPVSIAIPAEKTVIEAPASVYTPS